MKEIRITGSIRNIKATDSDGISFECGQEDAPVCVVDGVKAAVLHSLLMEGDPATVTGTLTERDGTPYVKVTGLNIL